MQGKVFPEFLSGRSTGVVWHTKSSSLLFLDVTNTLLPLPVFYRFLNLITLLAYTI